MAFERFQTGLEALERTTGLAGRAVIDKLNNILPNFAAQEVFD